MQALVASGVVGVRYALGDIINQCATNPYGARLDRHRVASYATFGAMYGGGPGFLWFNVVAPYLSRTFAVKPLQLALLDAFVHCPLMYYPMFYCCRRLLIQGDPAWFVLGMRDVRENFHKDMPMLCAFWVPVNTMIFRYTPLPYRMPCFAACGLAWAILLSATH